MMRGPVWGGPQAAGKHHSQPFCQKRLPHPRVVSGPIKPVVTDTPPRCPGFHPLEFRCCPHVARVPCRERVALAPPSGTRRPERSAPARTHQDGGVGSRSPAHGSGEECHQHGTAGLTQCAWSALHWPLRGDAAVLGRTLLPDAAARLGMSLRCLEPSTLALQH